MRTRSLLGLGLLLSLLTTGCPQRPPRIVIVPPPASAYPCWDPSDAAPIARELAASMLAAPWLAAFQSAEGRPPIVRVLPVNNRSADPVNGAELASRVEMELLRSGRVKSTGATSDPGSERADQARNASSGTAKAEGKEVAPDFLLNGHLLSEESEEGGAAFRAFLTTLELTRVGTNEKAWMGAHRFRKRIVVPR